MPKKDLLLLFDRPTEPVFMPKGPDGTVFDVPDDYLTDRYRPLANDLTTRFGASKVTVTRITRPDLTIVLKFGRRENFSLFFPYHRKLANHLTTVFMGMRTVEDFMSMAVYCRDRVNPYLFVYSFSVALLHRPDTKDLPIPTLAESFPAKYMDGRVFAQAREESSIVTGREMRVPIEIPVDYTASDLEEEHRVAYFREDIGVNLHHWHWHLVYPFDGERRIVAKDRRGELFYYSHQQIQARYNFERFCNNLPRVKRLLNWREPIPEGYFSKLDSLVSSRGWPPRFSNTILSDINREVDQISFDIQDLERWRDRIYGAIHSGTIVNDEGNTVRLTEENGIDILGNIVEASILSPNKNLYGDLHNLGHVMLALCHDPDNRHLETFSVIADPATGMRDPLFYRWHAFIDDLFQEYKATLPRYSTAQLDFPGVQVTDTWISSGPNRPRNVLTTHWQKSDVDLSRGLDFTPRGPIFARFTHIQHEPFTYNIQIDVKGKSIQGTVRIFLAPKFDERGRAMSFREHRLSFIEMDKFAVNLKPGRQVITRKSTQSNVTIPFERTFRDVDVNRPTDIDALDKFNFCGCGWPQHMLVPKGQPSGFPSVLFVMVSNSADDMIPQMPNDNCNDAAAYCGLRDNLYPDRRSMGFPFDRMPRNGADTLQAFLTPNMRVQDVSINFTNLTKVPSKPGQNSKT